MYQGDNNICFGSQIFEQGQVLKRPTHGVYAKGLQLFDLFLGTNKGCEIECSNIRMFEQTKKDRAANVAYAYMYDVTISDTVFTNSEFSYR